MEEALASGRRLDKKTFLVFFCAAVVTLTSFLLKNWGALLGGYGLPAMLGWNYPQYLVNYFQFGFVKRGVIGTLMYPATGDAKLTLIVTYNVAVLLTLSVVTAAILQRCGQRLARGQWLALAALVVLSPLTFVNFAFDFGRFDQINLLLLFFSLWLMRADRYWLAALLTGLALLIHEAYIFYGLPLVLLYPWYRQRRQKTHIGKDLSPDCGTYLRRMVPIFIVVCACLLALLLFGRYEPGRPELRAALPGNPNSYTVSELYVWTRPLLRNFHRVWLHWHRGGYSSFQIVLYCVILLAIVITMVEAYRANRQSLDALCLAPLAILPLFFIGIDYSRWLGLMWIVSLAVLMLKIIDKDFDRIFDFKLWNTPFFLLLCAIPLGPIGVQSYFPVFRYYFGLA